MTAKRPLRLATYNVEWFNALFDDRAGLLADGQPSARHKITRAEQLGALGIVFTALNADGVMIIEAPDTSRSQGRSTVAALENFARVFGLRQRKTVTGFSSETEQEIAFMYDPGVLDVRHDPKETAFAPRFDHPHRQDLDGDGMPEQLIFSKPPLELAVRFGDRPLRLIGVHNKSKSPRGARTDAEVRRLSIDNRRKQLAECQWLRLRVEAHLAAGDDLIVMGDFNDGPGLDDFEKLFGRSGVEVVLGTDAPPDLQLFDPHADMVLGQRLGLQVSTARFWHVPQKRFFEALLDYIMVSPKLRGGTWRVWHPLNDPGCIAAPELSQALLQASDHFPVSLDLMV
jgi:hypothetical protein